MARIGKCDSKFTLEELKELQLKMTNVNSRKASTTVTMKRITANAATAATTTTAMSTAFQIINKKTAATTAAIIIMTASTTAIRTYIVNDKSR